MFHTVFVFDRIIKHGIRTASCSENDDKGPAGGNDGKGHTIAKMAAVIIDASRPSDI
ncbi:MAG: hypothetical protein MI753_16055 [Hyphomicrobiales bacterium]|nr:hypothetical protein [Hyphomicrobiales bacterium]